MIVKSKCQNEEKLEDAVLTGTLQRPFHNFGGSLRQVVMVLRFFLVLLYISDIFGEICLSLTLRPNQVKKEVVSNLDLLSSMVE